jgi:hypothetical protein
MQAALKDLSQKMKEAAGGANNEVTGKADAGVFKGLDRMYEGFASSAQDYRKGHTEAKKQAGKNQGDFMKHLDDRAMNSQQSQYEASNFTSAPTAEKT